MQKQRERLRPTEDRVVIVPIAISDTSRGGIMIPDVAKEKPSRGLIEAVGPGRYENGQLIPMRLAVGDVVLFGRYSGTPYETEEGELLVFREMDILATITIETVEVDDEPEVPTATIAPAEFETAGPL